MKSFICEMFYKQRAAFEQSCASRGKEYPLPEDVFLQSDIFYDEKHVPAHRLDVYRPSIVWMSTVPGDGTERFSRSSSTYMAEASS